MNVSELSDHREVDPDESLLEEVQRLRSKVRAYELLAALSMRPADDEPVRPRKLRLISGDAA